MNSSTRPTPGPDDPMRLTLEPFLYPESPWAGGMTGFSASLVDLSNPGGDWRGTPEEGEADLAGDSGSEPSIRLPGNGQAVATAEAREDVESRIAAASVAAEERGLARGRAEGLVAGRGEAGSQIQAERDRLLAQGSALLESLDAARAEFFAEAEQETARLALSIAARILRRELQTDPLLLTGAVRVALGQLAAGTTVRLRVPARDREMWAEALALIPRLNPRPLVVGDEAMEEGECRIETELGSADLGLWQQVRAIERGLFDGVSGGIPGLDVGSEGRAIAFAGQMDEARR